MTEPALRLVVAQMSADAEFDSWVRRDPARALRDFDLTPQERDRLLRMNTHHDGKTKDGGGKST